jgi:hypothetical protein
MLVELYWTAMRQMIVAEQSGRKELRKLCAAEADRLWLQLDANERTRAIAGSGAPDPPRYGSDAVGGPAPMRGR